MSKKKIKQTDLTIQEAKELQEQYAKELDTNPEFKIEADPTGELRLTEIQKKFIMNYVNFRSIPLVADLLLISKDEAQDIFLQYNVQQEIRRINRAIYHHQFNNKMVSLDDIGGYLSSLLTDDFVPTADRLSSNEKLRVVDMLIRLNEMKLGGLKDPSQIAAKDLDVQIRNLSVMTIQALINQTGRLNDKNMAISKLDNGLLTPEEKAYLSTLPTDDLLALVEETNKGENENGNQQTST